MVSLLEDAVENLESRMQQGHGPASISWQAITAIIFGVCIAPWSAVFGGTNLEGKM